MKVFRTLGIYLLALFATGIASAQEPAFQAGTWSTVTPGNTPLSAGHMLLLTDGSVLVIDNNCAATGTWYRLVPDDLGNYVTGSWVKAGSLPAGYDPLYFASAVLPNGEVIVMGGEYNACAGVWTTLGAMYNPHTNKWTTVPAPTGWSTVGDAQSVILPDGKFMLANCCTTQEAILTSMSPITWTATGTGKFDDNDEEGWTLLPGGNLLTVDAYVGKYSATGMNSEIYSTKAGTWSSAGNTPVQLWDSAAGCGGSGAASYEVGPAVLRPDGTVFATGANACGAGHTAIYNAKTKTWSAGPNFPGTLDIADGPAALLPDGNVLLDTSSGIYQTGTKFFEWDGTTLHAVPGPPNATVDSSYVGNMLVLPTGQIMFTDSSNEVEIYTPSGSPCAGCAPTITSAPATLTHGVNNNIIQGTQFNGLSQGAAYGDDAQQATNFPVVQITDAAGHIVYCKTHGWSGGVATGAKIVGTQFDVPSTIALGPATLVVIANGIASEPVSVDIL